MTQRCSEVGIVLFVKQVVVPVVGIFIGVYCLEMFLDAVDPMVIRVGMPWSEAEPA